MTSYKCPQCGSDLRPVFLSSLFLNEDQLNAMRAGDFYCEHCPSNDRGRKPLCYWWEHEAVKHIEAVVQKITFDLDEKDSAVLHAEIARRQARSRFPDGGTILPEGESCIGGSLLAEAIRDLDEYRAIYDAGKNPKDLGALTRLILVSPETSRPLRISAPLCEVDGAAVVTLSNRIESWKCTIKMEEM